MTVFDNIWLVYTGTCDYYMIWLCMHPLYTSIKQGYQAHRSSPWSSNVSLQEIVLFDVSNNYAKSVTSKAFYSNRGPAVHWLSISLSSRLWSTPVPCRRTRLVMTASSPSRFFLLGASEFHKPRDGKRMMSIPWQSWHVPGYVRIFPSWILHSKRCVTGQFLFSHNIFSTMSSHEWAIAPWSLVGKILKVCALDIARPDVVHDFG